MLDSDGDGSVLPIQREQDLGPREAAIRLQASLQGGCRKRAQNAPHHPGERLPATQDRRLRSVHCLKQPFSSNVFFLDFVKAVGNLLLFSAHISYGKGKYLNQTGFFLQNLPRIYLYQS